MLKKKCSSCYRKIDNKFSFCPHCGNQIKGQGGNGDFGILGASDSINNANEMRLPFGMEKIMGSLIKQIEKQMQNIDLGDGDDMPREIKIRVARRPSINDLQKEKPKVINEKSIPTREIERRIGLKKVDANSKIKRLSDSIVYEIDAPGVKHKDDIELIELATGLEIKAYSKDKCYVKFIPLSFEVVNYSVKEEKVFVELRA